MMYHLLHPDSPYRLDPKGRPVAHYRVEDVPRIPNHDPRCPKQAAFVCICWAWHPTVGSVPFLAIFLWCSFVGVHLARNGTKTSVFICFLVFLCDCDTGWVSPSF